MAARSYYLNLFSPSTWQEFLEAGGDVTGFPDTRWNRLQSIRVGDRFLAYITGASKFVGVLEVTAPPYIDTSPIWSKDVYPARASVKIIASVDLHAGLLLSKLVTELEIGKQLKDRGNWSGLVRGSLGQWPAKDGALILKKIRGQKSTPDYAAAPPEIVRESPIGLRSTVMVKQVKGKTVIGALEVMGYLSFGNQLSRFELRPLNVLIGTNGSGKSNVIELLRSLRDLAQGTTASKVFGSEAYFMAPGETKAIEINVHDSERARHHLHVVLHASGSMIDQELFGSADGNRATYFRVGDENLVGSGMDEWLRKNEDERERWARESLIAFEGLSNTSFVSAFSRLYSEVSIYSDFIFGKNNPARETRRVAADSRLAENGANLLEVLLGFHHVRPLWEEFLHRLNDFNPRLTQVFGDPKPGGTRLYAHEEGLHQAISATRLSDGTLRYLWLLAILLHPNPASVTAIEEPELGLHPDIMPTIAELLLQAAQRTQLIVTTHSEHLVSALSEYPEAIVVVHRGEKGTELTRLDGTELVTWLQKYTLGQLWMRGDLGGTRW